MASGLFYCSAFCSTRPSVACAVEYPGAVFLSNECKSSVCLCGLFFCLTPWASPPLALLAGLIFGAIATHPYKDESRRASKILLQSAVVGLGFGMNLQEVVHAGQERLPLHRAGHRLRHDAWERCWAGCSSCEPRPAFLISTGTAICGGSAIAAVGPITGATEDEMSVSLGTIFVLNSVALLTFPAIGLWLQAFADAVWTVGGAGDSRHQLRRGSVGKVRRGRARGRYHREAGARALDRSPVDRNRRRQGQQDAHSVAVVHPVLLPGRGGEHLLLSRARLPITGLSNAGKLMLIITLFLIGASLSPAALRKVGPRPLLQGVLLWIVVAVTSLLAIRAGWIRI